MLKWNYDLADGGTGEGRPIRGQLGPLMRRNATLCVLAAVEHVRPLIKLGK